LIKVVSPIDDTPAAKAGIQPNDLITHIDNKPVTELTLNEAVDKMRGTPGTKITLTVRRGGVSGQPFDVTLTRAVIKIQSVKWEIKDDVAYIRITTFNEQTQIGLDKALTETSQKIGPKLIGYVLDLRNNPGGLLDEAISVSSTFLDAGKDVVSTRGRHKEENQYYTAKGGDRTHGKPIVILINGGTASASEIVAGALQDQHRAVVMGTKSFGKGSVQTIIPIADAGAMRLTTARYYTPSGRSIQQLGIEPDITVQPSKIEEIAQGKGLREADLRGALENDTTKAEGKKTKDKKSETALPPEDENDGELDALPTKKDDKKPVDYQLERALDLIRGLHLFESKTAVAPVADGAKK
jgi:carboxyl-terminal processing protease